MHERPLSPGPSVPIRVRVKICGITRPEDALWAARVGADAIGLVFYERSPRAVTVEQARRIVAQLPPFVLCVGLFVNSPEAVINKILDRVPLDLLQFHGDEPPEACARYGRPYIKAVWMRPGMDLASACARYRSARGLLLDTFVEGLRGGTGQAFDWSSVPRVLDQPIILAGGLTPDNVAEAVRTVRPYAVDVSGGVELRQGVKDIEKMRAFIEGVRNAEHS